MTYRKFVYKKLIRDKILKNMQSSGEKADFRKLDDHEYQRELINKLVEETQELNTEDPDLLHELADIQEVIDSLVASLGNTKSDLDQQQKSKREKYGSFNDRVFVDTVAIPEENKWVSYLEKHPDRYPEMTTDEKNN